MKTILTVGILFLIISCQSGNEEKNATTEKEVVITEVVTDTLNIAGMHCDMCVASIEKGVNELAGVEFVKANLEDSTAVVKYDAALLTTNEIEQAIEKRGYSVK